MARIPDEQIDRLKQEVSVQRLAEGMGITFKRHGADLLGLCPFHDNRTILDDYAQTEPVALPGCVSVRRLSYRLGHEDRRGVVPPCRGVIAGRLCPFRFSRRFRAG